MPYTNGITDQDVQYPNRFKIDGVSRTIEPDFGIVSDPGTSVNRDLITTILAGVGTTSGTAEALTLDQPGFVLQDGAVVRIKLHTDMAEGATLNVNGTGAKAIRQSNLKLVSGEQKAGAWLTLTYSLVLNAYVLQGMAGSFEVGDVLISNRTDLGDDWLLCNGEGISGTLYPKLYPLLFANPDGTWTANNQGSSDLYSVAYGNGYWVAVGNSGTLYYKADTPEGAWMPNNQGSTFLPGVAYGNGYWVAVGGSGTLYYKAGTPEGTWTANKQGSTYLSDVAYGNDYWVAVGDSGTLYYKAGTPGGTWTANKQGSSNLRIVAYGNGYWVAVGESGTLYYKAGTPEGAWTANNQGSSLLRSVAYGNGHWIVVGPSGTLYYKVKTLPAIALDGTYAYIRAK